MDKVGDMRVWWIPQLPMEAFHVSVESVREGAKIISVLANYDIFQYENNVKPDYCNAGGLQIYLEDAGEGAPGWVDWYDDETGIDDPVEFIEYFDNN